ncbi:MAG: diguanylate cyclase [Sulfuricurvum sp.]|nr:diguanylate cyclase [Sulfuricurvum sp.]
MEVSAKEVKSLFVKRYVIAISLVAILSTAAFIILHLALKVSDTTALIVNVSGKQRMLSQRIASFSQQYYHLKSNYAQEGANTAKIDEVESALRKAIKEMRKANDALSSGVLNDVIRVEVSPESRELYFGETELKIRVDNYLQSAEALFNLSAPKDMNLVVDSIVAQSHILLPHLHSAVLQYQKEGEENIERIQTLEYFAWALTLFTLMLEAIFIFQPMAERIRELFASLEYNKEHLEHQIQLRTLSLEQANLKLQHIASHDPLTGLKNRLNMERELEELLTHFRQNHAPFAALMLDIDWFKKVNDKYGHDIGDFVLQEVASILAKSIRDHDSAFRVGGEEFVILFNRITHEQALKKANKIRIAIEEHLFVLKEIVLHITISGGLYHPEITDASNVQGVLKLADNALYEAKRLGRNRIESSDQSELTIRFPSPPLRITIHAEGEFLDKIVFADPDIHSILGYEASDLVRGKIRFKHLLHVDDWDIFDQLKEMRPFMTTFRVMLPSGNVKIMKGEFSPVIGQGWEIALQDPIALAESVEDKMIVQNFEAMMENSDDYIYFKDRFHVFTAGSRTLVALTNVRNKEQLIGKTDYEVFPKEYADKYFNLEKEVFSGNIDVAREIQPTLDNEGNGGWVDNRKYPIKDEEGNIIGLFGIARVLSDVPDKG